MDLTGYEKTLVTARLDAIGSKKGRALAAVDVPLEYQSPDLTYVRFVLASEHENKNADYFSRTEMIQAYRTAANKPFNVEHNLEEDQSYISRALFNQTKNTIIGHTVDYALATKDGNIISEDDIDKLEQDDNPVRAKEETLDIVASAVLYNMYFPKTVADIVEMSEAGEMFVSMEAWFKGHDMLVGDEIVELDSTNASLVDDWNAGKVVGGRRVSRVLRQVLFGGVAATSTPANVGSLFITASDKARANLSKLTKRHDELHILYSQKPSSDFAKEHEEVTRMIAKLKQELN
jgi:hypothetical protein